MANLFKRIKLPDRLPELRGWAMTAYVAIWLALLPVAVAMPIAGSWLRYEQGAGGARNTYPLGFDEDKWIVTVVRGPEAQTAGLRPGDRILAVGGVATTQDETAALQVMRVADGVPVSMRVRTGSAPARTVTLHHRAATAALFFRGSGLTPDSLSLLSALIALIPWLVLVPGAALLFGRRRDPGAALFSITLLLLTQGATWAGLVWRTVGLPGAAALFGSLGGLGLMWSILTFPRGRFEPRWTLGLAAALPVEYALLQFVTLPEALATALELVIYGLMVVALTVRYRRESAADRQQWRWAVLGFAAGLALLLATELLYSPYINAHAADPAVSIWSWIGTPGAIALSITSMIAGVLLSVLRYRIYAAQSAVSRSLVFGTLTLSLLAVFAGTEKVVELVGEDYFGHSLGALAGGLGAAFAAVAIAPLHKRISGWVERRLRQDLLFLRQRFPRDLESSAEDETPQAVATEALAHTCRVLHARSGAIIGSERVLAVRGIEPADLGELPAVGSGETRLTISRDEALPVRLPLGGGALLLLGRKPDGSLYDKDERDALASLAEPLGRALRHAARERSRDGRLAELEAQVALLTASLRSSAA